MNAVDSNIRRRSAPGGTSFLDQQIREHIDLVYATARRQVSAADAEDVVQTVFVLFAERAPLLGADVGVVGWLYRTTRFCCLNFRKLQLRRQKHEREAAMMSSEAASQRSTEDGWLLDAALSHLRDAERNAILLHYLQGRTFAQTGRAMGVSENAARKRTKRAVQRLRAYFVKHAGSGAAVEKVFAASSAVKAPAALTQLTLAAARHPASSMVAGSFAHSIKHILFWSKMKQLASAAAMVAISGTIGVLLLVQMHRPPGSSTRSGPPPVLPIISLAALDPEPAPADPKAVTGFIADSHLPTDRAAVLWTFKSESPLSDSVVAGGRVYFSDRTGQIFALDAKDGSKVWTYKQAAETGFVPSVDDDQLYFGSDKGISAIRRSSGELIWEHPIAQGAGETTPLPVGERVFGSGYDGKAYALDRDTGEVVWEHDFVSDAPEDRPSFPGSKARFGKILARPNGSACDGHLFIQCVFDQSRVIALDCQTGEMRWEFQAEGWISPAPTIAGGRVYVVSQDQYLYCLELSSGKLLWQFKGPGWLASRVAVHDGIVLPARTPRPADRGFGKDRKERPRFPGQRRPGGVIRSPILFRSSRRTPVTLPSAVGSFWRSAPAVAIYSGQCRRGRNIRNYSPTPRPTAAAFSSRLEKEFMTRANTR